MPGKTNSAVAQMSLSLGPERYIYGVRALNAAVQRRFELDFRGIWVAGEISGCRLAPSGHYYFCLKEEQSQIKCALFKGAVRFAKFRPQEGLAVIARGNLEVYEARGEYQLIVELLEPQGAGALQLAFEQLKRRLAEEGLFEQSRKRALPRLPRRIGVVTSPTGAVIRDILHVLERRFPGLHVRLFPAQVQGEGSIEQVCAGLEYFSESGWAEVVIVARGGGSIEDLWTFNEEAVARAIAASKVPVISAVGHETDFTIADFVADHRAPTPSAAAEIVICTRDSLIEQVNAYRMKTVQALRYRLLMCSRDLTQHGPQRTAALLHRAIAKRAQLIDDLDFQMQQQIRKLAVQYAKRLTDLSRRLEAGDLRLRFAHNAHRNEILRERLLQAMRSKLRDSRRAYESLHLHLAQMSPLTILGRGYAIVQNAEGHVVRSAAETRIGERVHVRLHEGLVGAVVESRN